MWAEKLLTACWAIFPAAGSGGRQCCLCPPSVGMCSAAGSGLFAVVPRLQGVFYPKLVCALGRQYLFLHTTPALASSDCVFWVGFFFFFLFSPFFFSRIGMLLPRLSAGPRSCVCRANPKGTEQLPVAKRSDLSLSQGHLTRDNIRDLRVQF